MDLVVTLLQQGDASLVSFNMSDDDIVRIMRQPWTMTCSDGELTAPGQGKPHPRGYGAFARKLAAYVRDRHVIDLADAVRSMTSLPAMVFGLRDRGVIRDGAVADIVVLDPAQVQDRATYREPQQIAMGVRAVVAAIGSPRACRAVGAARTAIAGLYLRGALMMPAAVATGSAAPAAPVMSRTLR